MKLSDGNIARVNPLTKQTAKIVKGARESEDVLRPRQRVSVQATRGMSVMTLGNLVKVTIAMAAAYAIDLLQNEVGEFVNAIKIATVDVSTESDAAVEVPDQSS